MMVDHPILLPSFPGLLRQENNLHPLVNLQLATWLVSGVNMKVQQFHSQLKDCFWLHGEPGQKKTYSSAWRKWTCWCSERQVNPLSASLDSVLNFLASQFDAGLEYRTLNVYCSALSATHPQIEGFKVGEHPLVVQLLKGIFNSRPPTPRYTYTWDVSTVMSYLESLGPNEQLSLKQLVGSWHFCLLLLLQRGAQN